MVGGFRRGEGKCLTLADGGRRVSWNRNFRTGSRTGDIRIRSVGRSVGWMDGRIAAWRWLMVATRRRRRRCGPARQCTGAVRETHTHTHTRTHICGWTASIATAPSTPSVVHSAYDTIRDAIVKIFISPEWIYPVAKQTENNNFNYKYK